MSAIKFIIKDFKPSDAVQVNKVAVEAFQQFKENYSKWDEFIRGVGQMSSLSSTAEVIVAELKGKIVGAVGYVGPNVPKSIFPLDIPCIRMLVVDPQARGLGIGRALTQECINRAERDRAPRIGLHTSPIMDVALPLYLRMGFVKEKNIDPIRGVPYALYYKSLS